MTEEEIENLKQSVVSKQTTISKLEGDHQKFLNDIAGILWGEGEFTLADENNIREKVEELSKIQHVADSYKDQLQREQELHAEDIKSYEKRLNDLKSDMDRLHQEYDRKLDNVQARVDQEIAELSKARILYEQTNKFSTFFKKLFKRK